MMILSTHLQKFPVAMVTVSDQKFVCVQLIKCEDTKAWVSELLKQRDTISLNLYPNTPTVVDSKV